MQISELVEHWRCEGLPPGGLTQAQRAQVIEDAMGSYLAEFVAKTEQELLALSDKDLVDTHYWAMHEATR